HFSEDLLSVLLNEPIRGQGVFWSSAGETVYPISIRTLSFEQLVERQDIRYDRAEVATYAATLRAKYTLQIGELLDGDGTAAVSEGSDSDRAIAHARIIRRGTDVDVLRLHQERAVDALRTSVEFTDAVNRGGIPWGVVVGLLKDSFPASMDNRESLAFQLVPKALTALLGEEGKAWKTERRGGRNTLFVVKI